MPTQTIRKPLPGGCNIGCNTCAFRDGSETRREPYNTLKSALCDLGGVPFYCHHNRITGEDFHATDGKPPIRELKICEGWKQAMRERARDPRWRKNRLLRKTYAEIALGALERLVDNDDAADRSRCLRLINQSITFLVLRRPKELRLSVSTARDAKMSPANPLKADGLTTDRLQS